jgi:hypothetical protein
MDWVAMVRFPFSITGMIYQRSTDWRLERWLGFDALKDAYWVLLLILKAFVVARRR